MFLMFKGVLSLSHNVKSNKSQWTGNKTSEWQYLGTYSCPVFCSAQKKGCSGFILLINKHPFALLKIYFWHSMDRFFRNIFKETNSHFLPFSLFSLSFLSQGFTTSPGWPGWPWTFSPSSASALLVHEWQELMSELLAQTFQETNESKEVNQVLELVIFPESRREWNPLSNMHT